MFTPTKLNFSKLFSQWIRLRFDHSSFNHTEYVVLG